MNPHDQHPLASLWNAAPDARYKGARTEALYRTMRDGTQIAVDVMRPANAEPGARLPALLIMARYWRSLELRMPEPPNQAPIGPREPVADFLLARGFAVVTVDGRGSGASTGVSRHPWTPEEIADYGEIAAWVAAQPWCNGRVGALGISYEGATAERLAGTGVAAVRAVAPQEIEYDVYVDIAMPGGVFNEAFIRDWSESNRLLDANRPSSLFPLAARLMVKGVRPVDAERKARPVLEQALREHAGNTDVFAAMSRITFRDDMFGGTGATLDDFSLMPRAEAIARGGAAIFAWGSWLDGASAEAALRNFNTLPNPQTVVIGAWKHEMTAHGSPYQKPGAKPDPAHPQQWAALAQFFAAALERDEKPSGKQLFYYTLGAEAWKHSACFPPDGMQAQAWHFQAENALTPDAPPPGDASDRYTVDFEATTGRTNRWQTQMARPVVYADRAAADRRLLAYTSAPLAHDIEIAGYPALSLHVASSADDGAFFVYLEDVDERGVVRYISEGQLRGIHRRLCDEQPAPGTGMPRHPFTRAAAAPLPPGEMVELVIGLLPTAALFRRGHRIRVALAGADRGTFARIPADGAPPAWRVGRSAAAPSRITLPVVTRG